MIDGAEGARIDSNERNSAGASCAGEASLPMHLSREKRCFDVGRDQANAQLKVIAAAHEQAYPDDNKNQDLVVGTLDRLDISTRPQDDTQIWIPMGILQGLAATVLLTSCMNLANMMLAFGAARQKEIAIRLAGGGTTPVIIDVTLAERLFAHENPVGQSLQYGADYGTADSNPMVIVGLAPAVKHDLFKNRPEAHLYLPSGAADSTRMFVYARAAAPQTGDAIVRSVREQLRATDRDLPVTFVKSFRAQHEGSAQVWVLRAAARMFLTLGLAGTFVAVIGLYGVRSYLVSRRTREFGVRMAIGASPADVLRLVVRESLATTAAGLAIGLGLAMLLGWGLRAAIYQISPLDPLTLGGATAILAISSLTASTIPARRAANVLPMAALRND